MSGVARQIKMQCMDKSRTVSGMIARSFAVKRSASPDSSNFWSSPTGRTRVSIARLKAKYSDQTGGKFSIEARVIGDYASSSISHGFKIRCTWRTRKYSSTETTSSTSRIQVESESGSANRLDSPNAGEVLVLGSWTGSDSIEED